MDPLTTLTTLLPLADRLGIAVFLAGWLGYIAFARKRAQTVPSLLGTTGRVRYAWMMQLTFRDVRVFDGIVMQALSSSPAFFASTTILIIGGVLAVLGAAEKAAEIVRDVPLLARTSTELFDLKLLLLLLVFVHAFFRFTWSMRQYTFGIQLMASAPLFDAFAQPGGPSREAFADRASRVVSLAAESFNDGLRAYYFSFAVIGWFVSPYVFMAATAWVVVVLYRREFKSDVLRLMDEGRGA